MHPVTDVSLSPGRTPYRQPAPGLRARHVKSIAFCAAARRPGSPVIPAASTSASAANAWT